MADCPEECNCKWKSGKETVECRKAGFIEIPSNLHHGTQVLDMNLNNLQMLPMDTFMNAGLLHLQRIYLSGCSLAQIDKKAFRNLANLVELDISDNELSYVPTASFMEIPMLRKLYLSRNPIQKLQENAFEGLASLETLELIDCQIESIDHKAFNGLAALANLKLDGNRLATLWKKSVEHLTNLHGLHFTNNPWQCDCHLRDTIVWIEERNVPIGANPMCAGPPRLASRVWSTLEVEDFACEPRVVVFPTEIVLAAGENATLTCRVTADPEPVVRWIWKGKTVANSTLLGTPYSAGDSYGSESSLIGGQLKVFITEEGTYDKISNLTLVGAEDADSGVFACVAANHANRASANVSVTVHQDEIEGEGLTAAEVSGIAVGAIFAMVTLCVTGCLVLVKCDICSRGKRKRRELKALSAASAASNSMNSFGHRGNPEGSSSAAITALEERDMKLLGPNPIQKPPRLGYYHGVPTVDFDPYDQMNSVPISSYTGAGGKIGASDCENRSASPRDNSTPPPLWDLPQSKRSLVTEIMEEDEDEDDDIGLGRGVRDKLLPLPEAEGGKESEEDSGLESERGREEADVSLELDRIVLGKARSSPLPTTSTPKIPGRGSYVGCGALTADTSAIVNVERQPNVIVPLSTSAKVISEIVPQTPQFSLPTSTMVAPVSPMKAIALESPLPWTKVPLMATFTTFKEEAEDGTEV